MNLKKVLGGLIDFTPTLLQAVGVPALATSVIMKIGKSLLGKDDATEAEVTEAISRATPEQLVALKKIDADFKIELKNLDINLEKISAADRDSARNREIQTGDKTPAIMGFMIMGGFFGILGLLFFKGASVDSNTIQIINIMLGALGTMAMGVVSYYFGSSSGSRQKDIKIQGKSV